MGLKRYRRKIKKAVKRAGQGLERYGERLAHKTSEGWDRYKDEIIILGATVAGGAIGSIVPGVGTAAGAMLAGGLASGAVGAHNASKAERESDRQMRAMEGGLSEAYSRRRARRAGGEGVVDFDTMAPSGGSSGGSMVA